MSVIDAVKARLKRAEEHINAAHELSNSLFESGLYRIGIKHEGNGRIVVRVQEINPFPAKFSLLVSDAAHNIRAALDNIAFAVVKPAPGKEKSVYFPITTSSARFRAVAPAQLPGVSPRIRAAFERLQPYHRGKMPKAKHLAMLHSLNIWDKHRQLAICSTLTGNSRFAISISGGQRNIVSQRIRKGVLKVGAILATFHLSQSSNYSDVQVHPEILVAPIFDKGMPVEVRNVEVLRVLRESLWFVERTVLPSMSKHF